RAEHDGFPAHDRAAGTRVGNSHWVTWIQYVRGLRISVGKSSEPLGFMSEQQEVQLEPALCPKPESIGEEYSLCRFGARPHFTGSLGGGGSLGHASPN